MKISKRLFSWPRLSLFFLVLLASFNAGDKRSQYKIPIMAYSVFACDVDLEGDNDIIIGHKTLWEASNPSITLMQNIHNSGFVIYDTSKTFTGTQDNIFAVDLNNDNYPDIVTFYADFSSGNAQRYVRVFYNSKGFFQDPTDFPLNSSSTFSYITYSDINGDSKLDLLIASHQDQFWGILYNDGSGSLSVPEYHYIPDYYPTMIACGDLNDDGRDDLCICGQSTEVYFSYPGEFQSLILESHDFKDGAWITDFDNDGKRDILTFVGIPIVEVTSLIMYKNTGNNSFELLPEFYFPGRSSRFFISDFNNDSLQDILFMLSDKSGHIIYYNDGDFHLGDSVFVAVDYFSEAWRNCFCADLDGNGYIDIITIRTSGLVLPSNLDIKFNDGKGHFVDQPLLVKEEPTGNLTERFTSFPNPFHYQTIFEFLLSETEFVNLSIYDTKGKLITCLFNQKLNGGKHQVTWNCENRFGEASKPGLYFAILKSQKNGNKIIKIIAY